VIAGDRLAALLALGGIAVTTVALTRLAHSILGIIHDRPVVTKDPHTGELQIARSPNPQHRPRRHGRPQ